MHVTYWWLKSNFLLLRWWSNGLHAFYSPFLLSNPLRKGRCTSVLLCYKHRNALGLSTFQRCYNNVSPFSFNCNGLSFLFVMDFLFYLLFFCFLINSSPTPTILGRTSCFSFILQVFRSPQQNNSFKCKKKSLSALLQSPLLIAILLLASYLTKNGQRKRPCAKALSRFWAHDHWY